MNCDIKLGPPAFAAERRDGPLSLLIQGKLTLPHHAGDLLLILINQAFRACPARANAADLAQIGLFAGRSG
jgi:hypothetical protein